MKKAIVFVAIAAFVCWAVNSLFPPPAYEAHYLTLGMVAFVLCLIDAFLFVVYTFYLVGEALEKRDRRRK